MIFSPVILFPSLDITADIAQPDGILISPSFNINIHLRQNEFKNKRASTAGFTCNERLCSLIVIFYSHKKRLSNILRKKFSKNFSKKFPKNC